MPPAIVLIIDDLPLPRPPIIVFSWELKETSILAFSFNILLDSTTSLIIISGLSPIIWLLSAFFSTLISLEINACLTLSKFGV